MNGKNLRLKAERIMRNKTQEDMCKILGMKHRATYSMKETGKRAFSIEEIKIISNEFGLTAEQMKTLFFDEESDNKDMHC